MFGELKRRAERLYACTRFPLTSTSNAQNETKLMPKMMMMIWIHLFSATYSHIQTINVIMFNLLIKVHVKYTSNDLKMCLRSTKWPLVTSFQTAITTERWSQEWSRFSSLWWLRIKTFSPEYAETLGEKAYLLCLRRNRCVAGHGTFVVHIVCFDFHLVSLH